MKEKIKKFKNLKAMIKWVEYNNKDFTKIDADNLYVVYQLKRGVRI